MGFNQAQFSDASHVLVFCGRSDVAARIDEYEEMATGGDEAFREKMAGYMGIMRGAFEGKSEAEVLDWADRQAYIALGFAMAACAELEIDSCPMEGFLPAGFDKILEVPEHMKSVVSLAVGYRSADPRHPKLRYSEDDLFTKI